MKMGGETACWGLCVRLLYHVSKGDTVMYVSACPCACMSCPVVAVRFRSFTKVASGHPGAQSERFVDPAFRPIHCDMAFVRTSRPAYASWYVCVCRMFMKATYEAMQSRSWAVDGIASRLSCGSSPVAVMGALMSDEAQAVESEGGSAHATKAAEEALLRLRGCVSTRASHAIQAPLPCSAVVAS